MLTYTTKLIASPEDLFWLREMLCWERDVFNIASKEQFPEKRRSLVVLHNKVYHRVRKEHPHITSQVVIRGIHSCLAAYRSANSNKRILTKPFEKRRLSMRLDHNLYAKRSVRFAKANETSIRIRRKTFTFTLYPKLQSLLNQSRYRDPVVFERDGELHIALTFDAPFVEPSKQQLALGVDLGCHVAAATSDGRLIMDKKFAKEKRRLRFLKSQLRSASMRSKNPSKSAKRHLKKLRRKEADKNRNQTHLVANEVLKTDADTIVLENLKGIKAKRYTKSYQNRLSQVPLAALRITITYKAEHMGKHVLLVRPYMTSQTDCLTGKREGERRGRRFYAKSGLIYDSDINAAVNIAKLSKLPCSLPEKRLLAGQALVSGPNVGARSLQVS